jgi:hypothetical protein
VMGARAIATEAVEDSASAAGVEGTGCRGG